MSDAPALSRFPAKTTDFARAHAQHPAFGRGLANGLVLALPLWGLIIYGLTRLF